MDPQVIDQKLESLRRCLMHIESKEPFEAEQLADDFDPQDIVSLILTRAVQMAVDIGAHIAASQNQPGPATMAETFEQLHGMGVISGDLAIQLKKSVGFRNIAAHNYSTINWQVVHAIIAGHLDDFKDFARAVSLWQLGSSVQTNN
jgi:uncharacterized protein YutE (UPF0331/DUF86 family)